MSVVLDKFELRLIHALRANGPANAEVIAIAFSIDRCSAQAHLEHLWQRDYVQICDGHLGWYEVADGARVVERSNFHRDRAAALIMNGQEDKEWKLVHDACALWDRLAWAERRARGASAKEHRKRLGAIAKRAWERFMRRWRRAKELDARKL